MATFRKSSSKTRSSLENSTALPPVDVMSHVGEQAAHLAETFGKGKASAPKAGKRSAASQPAMLDPAPLDHGIPSTHEPQSTAPVEPAVAQIADATEAAAASMPSMMAEVAEDTLDRSEHWSRDVTEQALASADNAAKALMDDATGLAETAETAASKALVDAAQTAEDIAAPVGEAQILSAEHSASAMADAAEAVAQHAARATFDAMPNVNEAANASQTLGDFNAKLADVFHDYLVDSIGFFAALTAVRSMPEAMTLNSQHMQRRMEIVLAQSRDLTVLAGKLATEAMTPFTPAASR